MNDVRAAAGRYVGGELDDRGHFGTAWLMPTRIKTGIAASINNGRVHLANSAALATDGTRTVLAVRWVCGGGSSNARPAEIDEVACESCERLQHLPEGPVVYRCYDDEGALLYIGSSINLRQRVRGHRGATRWWDEVVRVEAESYPTETAARIAEAHAIRDELPERNKYGIPLEVIKGGRSA